MTSHAPVARGVAYEPFGAVLRAGATRTHRLLRRTAAALLGGGSLWTLVVLASVAARAQSGPFLYVPNSSPNTVSVIDTSTNTTTSPAIPVGNGPINAAVSGDEALVYVTNSSSNTVSVINTATNTVVATINVGSTPVDAVVSPDGTRVYVTNINGNTVSVINTATNTVAATINVGSGPHDAVVSPDGTRVYVTNWNGLDVSVINTATNTVVATIINVGAGAGGAAVSPDGTRVYTANYNSNTVSVINTTTNTVVATINVGSQPSGVAVSPDGTRAYVTNVASNTVSVINTATNTVVATINVGNAPAGAAVSPDGTRVYVPNYSSNTVSVINTATNTVVATIINVVQPYFPGICSNGNALLATGLTFVARTSGALACTLASGPTGSPGPVLTGGTLQFAGAGIASALPISLQAAGGTFDTSGNNATLSGAISGPGSLTKIGVGTLTLDGTSGYTGATTVNAGTLIVNGSIASSSLTSVNSGGTLAGTGALGNVTVNNGGTLAPGAGAPGPGHIPGTITLGSLTLNAGSTLQYELGTPNVINGPTNDLTIVNGNLTITSGTSTLNVLDSGSFGLGLYRLINYTGALGGSGSLAIGTLPGLYAGTIQTSISGEVNLVVSAPGSLVQYWDGAQTTANGTVDGGTGTWNNSTTNWTTSTGTINASWQGGMAVFAGTAGTVTVSEPVAFQDLQFSTTGYVVTASGTGALTPTGIAQVLVDSGVTATISAPITGTGGLEVLGTGTLILSGANTYLGTTTIGDGFDPSMLKGGATNALSPNSAMLVSVGSTLDLGGFNQTIFSLTDGTNGGGTVTNSGASGTNSLIIGGSAVTAFSGTIQDGLNATTGLTLNGTGTLTLTGTNTYTGGTTINAGTLQLGNGGTSGSITGDVLDNGTFAINRSDTYTFGGMISGTGAFQQLGTGTTIFTGANTYTGGTTINAGTLQLGNGGTSGSITGDVLDNGTFAINRSDTYTFGGMISGTGAFQQLGTGTTIFTGISSFTGATTVNAGTLLVNGDISSSSGVTVNFGGTLGGSGTVSPTTINSGGTLAPGSPGTTLNVAGNLAFQPGSLYLVKVGPSSGSNANVTGSATLTDGSVQTLFTSGNNVLHSYDILHATVGLSGTTFSGVSGNVPTNFTESLSYTATDVFLNLTAALGAGGSLSGNQQNVAGAINSFFNNGGTLPPGFLGLFNLTGPNLANALTLLSGEAATGAQTGAFQLMNSFLGLMVDQSLDAGNGNGAPAMPIKAPPARSSQPWSAWGSAYGGTNHANGDATVVGSHDVRTNTWGIAAGLDYRLSPDTKIGFALGGAGTNWGLSDGLGGGKSDAFQAGIYGLTRSGPAYLSGALAFSSYWVSTDRVAFASDQLTANFNAYGIGGRLEGGYRFATPVVGFTPYAALQAQSFHIPSYSETDVTGGGFGLAYNAHTASDTRSELGARLDKQIALDNGAVLALRGRAAWAHDWVTDPSLTAVFQALPGGGGFVVNGATPAHNSALVTAGAEIKLRSGWSVMAKFDGEFASGSQTYTGTGKLRYTW